MARRHLIDHVTARMMLIVDREEPRILRDLFGMDAAAKLLTVINAPQADKRLIRLQWQTVLRVLGSSESQRPVTGVKDLIWERVYEQTGPWKA